MGWRAPRDSPAARRGDGTTSPAPSVCRPLIGGEACDAALSSQATLSPRVHALRVLPCVFTPHRYHCLPPERVFTPSLPSLLGGTAEAIAESLATLRRDRILVLDDALPAAALALAAAEASNLEARGHMRGEARNPCNPGEVSMELGLWDVRRRRDLVKSSPGIARAVQGMWNLGVELGSGLDLSVRVPQVALLASYPPGALYHRHMDSYGGVDIPRLLTVLVYLSWEPQQGGTLRAYPPGGATDVEPRPGRLVVFYSQEVEHEVLQSIGRRHALTYVPRQARARVSPFRTSRVPYVAHASAPRDPAVHMPYVPPRAWLL